MLDKFEDIGLLETFYAGAEDEDGVAEAEELDNRNIHVNVNEA